LGFSEFGKAVSQNGNIRGGVILLELLELVQAQRIGLLRVNTGSKLTSSLRSSKDRKYERKMTAQTNIKRTKNTGQDSLAARAGLLDCLMEKIKFQGALFGFQNTYCKTFDTAQKAGKKVYSGNRMDFNKLRELKSSSANSHPEKSVRMEISLLHTVGA